MRAVKLKEPEWGSWSISGKDQGTTLANEEYNEKKTERKVLFGKKSYHFEGAKNTQTEIYLQHLVFNFGVGLSLYPVSGSGCAKVLLLSLLFFVYNTCL